MGRDTQAVETLISGTMNDLIMFSLQTNSEKEERPMVDGINPFPEEGSEFA